MFYLRSHDKLSRISGFFIILLLLIPTFLSFIPVPVVNAITTDTYQVSADSDDCQYRASGGGYFDYISNINYIGDNSATYYDYEFGVRFQNVVIPSGATIISAYLNVTAYDQTGIIPEFTINGEDDGDPSTYSNEANYVSRLRTTATVTWTSIAWVQFSQYLTSDIASIVQEIIELGTWVSGNAMAFMCKDSGSGWNEVQRFVGVITHDYSTGDLAVYLHVTWSLAVNYVTLYNQSGSVFMIDGVKMTNGTTEFGWTNETVLELQGIINRSYTFIEWDFIVSNVEVNPYNFTVAGNDTIWLMVDPVGAGGLSSSWVLSGFLWILLILCPIIVIVLWRLR